MSADPPAAWEDTTTPYDIRVPKSTAWAGHMRDMFIHLAEDFAHALDGADVPTVTPAPMVVAASAAARDAHWGVPATTSERLALQNAGATTIRTDTGLIERYFANTTDGGSNPGGRASAGWYRIAGDDTGWLTPTLQNSWAQSGSQTIRYRRIGGIVYLRGRLTGGTTAAMFTLPTGFRPSQGRLYGVISGTSGTSPVLARVIVNTNGTVEGVSGSEPNLDVITFPAA